MQYQHNIYSFFASFSAEAPIEVTFSGGEYITYDLRQKGFEPVPVQGPHCQSRTRLIHEATGQGCCHFQHANSHLGMDIATLSSESASVAAFSKI